MTNRYRNGDFDILAIKEILAADDYRLAISDPIAGYQSVDTQTQWNEMLPLIVFSPGGLNRDTMFEHITHEGKLCYVAFLAVILYAVGAGLSYRLLPVRATAGRRVTSSNLHPHLGIELPMTLSLYRIDENAI